MLRLDEPLMDLHLTDEPLVALGFSRVPEKILIEVFHHTIFYSLAIKTCHFLHRAVELIFLLRHRVNLIEGLRHVTH